MCTLFNDYIEIKNAENASIIVNNDTFIFLRFKL